MSMIAFGGLCSGAEPGEDRETSADNSERFILISGGAVSGIPGKFLLLRKEKDVCAVRFINLRRQHDDKSPSRISSGEENTFAEYEWFYQGDGSGNFNRENVERGEGSLHRGPAYGVGFDIIIWRSPDKRWIECGSMKVVWMYPAVLTFVSYDDGKLRRDEQLEIAPTKWSRIEEVDTSHKKLQWSKLDTGVKPRPDVRIPVVDLP